MWVPRSTLRSNRRPHQPRPGLAAKRFEVAKARYVIGKIGISDLYIGLNEKDQALQAYVQALRQYWSRYYRLRRVTLYDFAKGGAIR